MASKPSYYCVHWSGPDRDKNPDRPKLHTKDFKVLEAAKQYASQLNTAFPERKARVYEARIENVGGFGFVHLDKVVG